MYTRIYIYIWHIYTYGIYIYISIWHIYIYRGTFEFLLYSGIFMVARSVNLVGSRSKTFVWDVFVASPDTDPCFNHEHGKGIQY